MAAEGGGGNNNGTIFTASENFRYLIVKPQNGGIIDVLKFLVTGNKTSGAKFLESSDVGVIEEALSGGFAGPVNDDNDGGGGGDGDGGGGGGGGGGGVTPDHRWVIIVSIIVRKLIAFFGKPMEWNGYVIEYILNLLSHNGNLIGLIYNILRGRLVLPHRGSETFISAIGHLDGRIDLYKIEMPSKVIAESDTGDDVELKTRTLMDLCIMASKLSYENENVVRNVVNVHWKMHFVDFFNCWNDYQKERSTQVFIMCDKPKDANLILISFRGTEPFDADDWITDFDYSWYEIPKVGKVHMGFLEALGLGSRMNTSTFLKSLQVENVKAAKNNGVEVSNFSSSFSDSEALNGPDQSSESKQLMPLMGEMSAYYAVKSKLKSLLKMHKNAKFLVTGHSLGGALAILFPVVLNLHEEMEVLQRLSGVYTYGQPRVGNWQLGQFMEAHLDLPVPKYFRIVYCNDLVPRLPYDDKTFLYKHFGACLYYNSVYIERRVGEEPNRNYFGLRYLLPGYLNAVWELIRSFIIAYVRGPEYKECWESILLRIMGLAMPGIAAHSPVDYVNSVRLGRESANKMATSF